nr:MAG TPA: hypothetical protein [Caudoviricetes sp.]
MTPVTYYPKGWRSEPFTWRSGYGSLVCWQVPNHLGCP